MLSKEEKRKIEEEVNRLMDEKYLKIEYYTP